LENGLRTTSAFDPQRDGMQEETTMPRLMPLAGTRIVRRPHRAAAFPLMEAA
jgi:hypothetical protein